MAQRMAPDRHRIVVVNPNDDVTPEAFAAWLARRADEEPIELNVTAAETLAELRAEDEV